MAANRLLSASRTSNSSKTAPNLNILLASFQFLHRTSMNIPVASHFACEIGLDQLKVVRRHFPHPVALQNHHPGHDRRDLSLERQLRTQVQQSHEICSLEVGHLVRIRLFRLVDDMRCWGTRGHQSMPAHVLVLAIVRSLHWVVERFTFGIVRANHEVLHVLHAGTFETTETTSAQSLEPLCGAARCIIGLVEVRGRPPGWTAQGCSRTSKQSQFQSDRSRDCCWVTGPPSLSAVHPLTTTRASGEPGG